MGYYVLVVGGLALRTLYDLNRMRRHLRGQQLDMRHRQLRHVALQILLVVLAAAAGVTVLVLGQLWRNSGPRWLWLNDFLLSSFVTFLIAVPILFLFRPRNVLGRSRADESSKSTQASTASSPSNAASIDEWFEASAVDIP